MGSAAGGAGRPRSLPPQRLSSPASLAPRFPPRGLSTRPGLGLPGVTPSVVLCGQQGLGGVPPGRGTLSR